MGCAICEMALFVPLTTLKEPKRLYVEPNLLDSSKAEVAKLPDIEPLLSSGEDGSYDVVIMLENSDCKKALSMLSSDGIAIFRLSPWGFEAQKNIEMMKSMRDDLEVLMPYSLGFGIENNLLFASKKYHPLSDMILQRADFIEGCEYYTPEIHKAAFVLPANIKRALRGVAKN